MEIVPHDPVWASEFQALSHVLWGALGEDIIAVEHIGSTAVPGLAARPVLDIDVVLRDPAAFEPVSRALASLGYDHQGDLGIAGREAFGRFSPDVPFDGSHGPWMDHHLYVCVDGATELRRHDKLRSDPRAAKEYQDLKVKLAARYGGDRARYVAGKGDFVESLLESR